ncbi:MAG: hypothetical protein JW894_08590 [Bacteroidales bacterium]|nr:hypothetical protein [Bacteroidales bacterium]
MIVVFSYNGDVATAPVLDWLLYYGCIYKRINLEDEDFRNISVVIDNKGEPEINLKLSDGETLKMNEVNYFLYRGGRFRFEIKSSNKDKIPYKTVKHHLKLEFKTLTNLFYQQVSKKCLGNILHYPLNKLKQLTAAAEVGIKIPETIISYSGDKLVKKWSKYKKPIITKAIQENVFLQIMGDKYIDLKVTEVDLMDIEETFFPSLFQESIKKSIEIRSFYLAGNFYSIAMILKHAKERVIDFRTHTNDIRYCRYNLPVSLEKKLHELMRRLNLITGSIDLIQSDRGEYYFLEVNPTGQFGWVSYYGNYCIEKKIAAFLAKKDRNEEFKKSKIKTS